MSGDGRTITFTPASPLVASTTYAVTVNGLVSTEGGTLATQTWSFTTGIDDTGTTSLFADLTPANSTLANRIPFVTQTHPAVTTAAPLAGERRLRARAGVRAAHVPGAIAAAGAGAQACRVDVWPRPQAGAVCCEPGSAAAGFG